MVGYKTMVLPAFFSRNSDQSVDYQLDSPEDIATALHAKWSMNLQGGVVIANPIPERYAMPREVIDLAINQALLESKQQKITGKAITPFLLSRVCELTGGDSLNANIQLVLNNARLAADIARHYCSKRC